MGKTIPGGCYEDAPGSGTYHDAHGKPVAKDAPAKAEDESTKKTAKGK